jgi:hypothetical protein
MYDRSTQHHDDHYTNRIGNGHRCIDTHFVPQHTHADDARDNSFHSDPHPHVYPYDDAHSHGDTHRNFNPHTDFANQHTVP